MDMEDSEDIDQAMGRMRNILLGDKGTDGQDKATAAADVSDKRTTPLRRKSSIYSNLSTPVRFSQTDLANIQTTVEDYDLDREEEKHRAEQMLQDTDILFKEEETIDAREELSPSTVSDPPPGGAVPSNQPIRRREYTASDQSVSFSHGQVSSQANLTETLTKVGSIAKRITSSQSIVPPTSVATSSNKKTVPLQVPANQNADISVPRTVSTNHMQGFLTAGQDVQMHQNYSSQKLHHLPEHYQCITVTRPEYNNCSLEELRLHHYIVNRVGRLPEPTMPSQNLSRPLAPPITVIPQHLRLGQGYTQIRKIKTDIIPHTDSCRSQQDICDLLTQCQVSRCELYHSTARSLPYEWRVLIDQRWYLISDSEKVENAYCDLTCKGVQLEIVKGDAWCHVFLEFKDPELPCYIVTSYNPQMCRTDTRRVSTWSYAQGNLKETHFRTQWRWYWKDDTGIWNLFDTDTMQYTLETKYLAGQTEYLFMMEHGKIQSMYMISFTSMVQRNLQTSKCRSLLRRPLFVSSSDRKCNKMPPRLSDFPLIETTLPEGWVPWDHANNFELVRISEDSGVFKTVSDKFFKSLTQVTKKIEFIYRVQNPMLWTTFCSKKELMTSALQRKSKGETLNVKDLFHGTSDLDSVHGICTHNFDQRLSGKNATAFGDGTYFAVDSSFSHRYTSGKQRYMFLAHVIVGKYTKGKGDYRRPPAIPGSKLELYDSCADKETNPSIFVLFEKSQHYPAYLIQYVER